MGQLIAFPIPRRPAPTPGQIDAVSDLLLALEDAPLFDPAVVVTRDLSGHPEVSVTVAGRLFRLTPTEIRLTAETLIAEQAFAGCVGLAVTLNAAADLADRMARVA